MDYPAVVQQAAAQYSPAIIANFSYDLVKAFNSFYQNVSILGEADQEQVAFHVTLAQQVGGCLQRSTALLGMDLPQQM